MSSTTKQEPAMQPKSSQARDETTQERSRSLLRDFLREQRAAIAPEDAGLIAVDGHRRVIGLRREEVARLAGVSVDYYVRLEQGRAPNASEEVLRSVARVLRLNADKYEHLCNLVRHRTDLSQTVSLTHHDLRTSRTLKRLVSMMHDVPAIVLNECMDLLYANAMARTVFRYGELGILGENLARAVFLRSDIRAMFVDLDTVAANIVAYLRLQTGRADHDSRIDALVEELTIASAEFRTLWSRQDVRRRTTTYVVVEHPDLGRLEFTNIFLAAAGTNQVVVAYTVEPQSQSAAALDCAARSLRESAGRRWRPS